MMNLITVENISKSYGFKNLFHDVSFGIAKGEKTALLAKNGAGKTTLMKIIAGFESPDNGLVTRNKDIKVSILSQSENFQPEKRAIDVMLEGDHPAIAAFKTYQSLVNAGETDGAKLQKAFDAVEKNYAWDIEDKARQLLSVLGLPDETVIIKTLSGGQLKRLSLAVVLLEEPDLILLDEPTNHLDMEMIEWLEDYLKNISSALFIVTHDRYFLDRVCNSIVELENQQIYKYKGNYSYYLEKKTARDEQEASAQSKLQNKFRKELEWMRRQPKARTTKSKSRTEAFYDIAEKSGKRKDQDNLKAELNPDRMGSKIVELIKISKSYPDKELITNFTYSFSKGDKIGLIGKNGSGKSTLLNIITGKDQVDSGKVIIGETINFGYYHQSGISFKPGQRVIEYIRDVAEYIPLTKGKTLTASQMLENFMFPRSMHFQEIEQLSGGEKKRLYLLSVFMKNPNFLILDEPTNDLDIYTIQALEAYLQQFEACLVIVSHDRFFIDKTVDRVFILDADNGDITDFPGNYSDYYTYKKAKETSEQQNRAKEKKQQQAVLQQDKKTLKSTGLSYKERQEFNKLEKKISELEEEKNELTKTLYEAGADAEKSIELSQKLSQLEIEIDEKMHRWIELSEIENDG